MKDIIAKRIFWVVLGVAFVGLMVFYVFVVWGLAGHNNEVRASIKKKIEQMETYAKKKDIKNGKWIVAAQARKAEVDAATEECAKFFGQNRDNIKTRFLDEGAPITDAARWKDQYYTERHQLEVKLKDAGMQFAKDAFDFRDWGERIPTPEEIDGERTPEGVVEPGAQKEFWLQSNLVNCLVNVTAEPGEEGKGRGEGKAKSGAKRSHVVRLVKIAIQRPMTAEGAAPTEGAMGAPGMPGGAPGVPSVPQFQLVSQGETAAYLVIPFTLTVDMDWRFVPLLIRNLETSPWSFYVVTLDATRVPRVQAEKEAGEAGIGTTSSLVRLTLHAQALDFTPMGIKIAAAPGPVGPGGPGRPGGPAGPGRPGGPGK